MIDNELLKQALDETADDRFSKYELLPGEKPHRFSLFFKIREKSIIRLSKKPEKRTRRYMPLKRMAVIITVISVLEALGIAAGAGYAIIKGFNIYSQSSHYFGITHTDTILEVDYSKYDIKSEIAMDEFYCLPEESGCTFVERGMYDQQMNCIKYDRNGKRVSFGQYTSDTGLFMDDISDVVFHEVEVKGGDGVLCTETDSEDKSLTWVQDGYVFSIYAKEISEEEIMSLAETITTYEADPSEFDQPNEDEGFLFDFSKCEIKNSIEEQYWLPPETGCTLANEKKDEDYSIDMDYYYYNDEITFYFRQRADNPHMEVENVYNTYEVTVKDADVAYISRYDDGEVASTLITWVYNGYVFQIDFYYNFSDEEMIALAESIVIRD